MKFLTAIVTVSLVIMITASAGYYFYNSSVNNSSYPSYHVDMHLNTTIPVPYYPIHVNSNLTGNGTYQQLLTFSDPSHYGINANGSNLAFYDGSNNTHLYAWIQSINSTSMQVWVKNYYGSTTINMQVLPSFENLFSATGYLGEAPQLSSTYAEYFNAPLVFGNDSTSWDFAGTSVSGWSGGSYTVNNGLIPDSSNNVQTTSSFNPLNYTAIWAFSGNPGGRYGGWAGSYASWICSYSSTQFSLSYYLNGSSGDVVMNGNINSNYNTIIYGERPTGIFAQLNNNPETTYNNTEFADQSTPTDFYFAADGITVYYVILLPQTITMPTFTIGTFTNMTDHAVASYLSNSITIPMPNWFNLTLKAYTNYSFTFHYNNTPLYFTYDGLINNTIYTGFLDSNLTLDIHFIALGYSGKTELIVVGEKT